MKDIVLYGSGKRCLIIIDLIKKTNIRIKAIVDSNPERENKKIDGYLIESPEILYDYTDTYICVTFYSSLVHEPVWERLEEIGFDKNHIISFHDIVQYIYRERIRIPLKSTALKEKILFDGAWEMGLGGVESWLRDIVTGLIYSGRNDVYLLTRANQDNKWRQISNNVIDFCLSNAPVFSEEYIDRSCQIIVEHLPCIMVFSRVDELMMAAAFVKEAYGDKLKIIMADHGSCDGMYRDILSYRKYIDYYVCVSSGIRDFLLACEIEKEKIDVMTCPVPYDTRLFRKYMLDPDQAIRIGYAGRLEIFEKRVDILKSVIDQLEIRNVNYIFSIAGEGSQYEYLKNYIESNSLQTKVFLLGRIKHEEMGTFWKKQDIAINTSDNEGRPLSNMEAMVNGAVPVVTHTVGVLDDVHDGKNGFIVPIEGAIQMAERIAYLENNRYLLPIFGENARNEMLGKIDIENHVSQWKQIFERVR